VIISPSTVTRPSETSPLALLDDNSYKVGKAGLASEELPALKVFKLYMVLDKESCKMDHDLLMMLYGALVGASSRVITSMVTSTFQLWLEHRDHERQRREQQYRQARQIYLPTPEEVRAITSHRYQENQTAAQHRAVGTGSILISVVGGGFLIHQARESILSLGFAAIVAYLLTNSMIKRLKR
jgi:hypothetical protein